MPRIGNCGIGSRQGFSWSRSSFLVLCRDSGFCFLIGLGLGTVFLGHNSVCSLS